MGMTEKAFKVLLNEINGHDLMNPLTIIWKYKEEDLYDDDLYFEFLDKQYILPRGMPVSVEDPFAFVNANAFPIMLSYLMQVDESDNYPSEESIKSLAPSWNKTVYLIYSKKKSKKYKKHINIYLEWFDENDIDIDRTETLITNSDNVPDQGFKKTKKTKGKGGRPIDPDLQDKKDRLNKEYYQFTQKQGSKSSKAIEILSKKYNWKKSTIETYLK